MSALPESNPCSRRVGTPTPAPSSPDFENRDGLTKHQRYNRSAKGKERNVRWMQNPKKRAYRRSRRALDLDSIRRANQKIAKYEEQLKQLNSPHREGVTWV